MLRRRRSANSFVDAATVAALRTTINTITTVAKTGATLIARATESDEVVAWRAPAMSEVEIEEVAIATMQALGEFYKQNRRAINLIVRAYILYVFLSMVLQLALALLQFAFTCVFTLFIFIVLYKLPLAANMDLIFA